MKNARRARNLDRKDRTNRIVGIGSGGVRHVYVYIVG